MAPYEADAAEKEHTINAAKLFSSSFGSYQKLLEEDYLEHNLLFSAIKTYLSQLKRKSRILDLGCGDAENLSKVLKEAPETVSAYTGVDMSESALHQAQKAVQKAVGTEFPVFFHFSDMLSFLKKTIATYDTVIAAFSLHHLLTKEKAEALREIHRLVSPVQGTFVMVDPFRRADESLAAYHVRATEVGESWTFLGADVQQRIIKHMQDYDVIEKETFFEEAGRAAGFKAMEVVCRGEKGLQSNVTVFHS